MHSNRAASACSRRFSHSRGINGSKTVYGVQVPDSAKLYAAAELEAIAGYDLKKRDLELLLRAESASERTASQQEIQELAQVSLPVENNFVGSSASSSSLPRYRLLNERRYRLTGMFQNIPAQAQQQASLAAIEEPSADASTRDSFVPPQSLKKVSDIQATSPSVAVARLKHQESSRRDLYLGIFHSPADTSWVAPTSRALAVRYLKKTNPSEWQKQMDDIEAALKIEVKKLQQKIDEFHKIQGSERELSLSLK